MGYTILQNNSNTVSAANQFYTGTATLTPLSDGEVQVTVTAQYPSALMDQQGLVPGTADGSPVYGVIYGQNGGNYTCTYSFNVPSMDALKNNISGTVHVTVPSINMSEDFGIQYDFASNTSTTPIADPSNPLDSVNNGSSSNNGSSESSSKDATDTVSNSDKGSSSATKTADPTQGWTYEVLQADSNAKSTADQYYTHVAKVTKLANGKYQVTLEVSYAKSLGMGSKGVVPLTIDGQKAQNVTYGTSGSNYTVTYSFDIDSLDALNKIIDGTIHVTVPMVNISQDFGVRFKFSHAATSDTDSSAANKKDSSSPATTNGNGSGTTGTATSPDKKATATVNPGNNNATGSSSKSYLPQTNEQKQQSLMMLGFLAVASLIGFTIYKRRHA